MSRRLRFLRRSLLPAGVFLLVIAAHFAYLSAFPEKDPAQARWAPVATAAASPWSRYVSSQSYWLGLSYAMSLAFAVAALRRYREKRQPGARNLAVGSVTLSGVLAVAGCFLLGCCGSPMLAVYLSLFGAAFIPLAKPLVAILTALSLTGAWLWMNHHEKRASCESGTCCGQGAACRSSREALPRGLHGGFGDKSDR